MTAREQMALDINDIHLFISSSQVVQPITFEYRCIELVTNHNCSKRKRPTNENGVLTFYAVLCMNCILLYRNILSKWPMDLHCLYSIFVHL